MTKKLKIESEIITTKVRNEAILIIALFTVFIISLIFSMVYMFL